MRTKRVILFVRIFGGIFILLAICAAVGGVRALILAHASEHWPNVQGDIIKSEIRETTRGAKGDSSANEIIRYSYIVNGQTMVGKRVVFGVVDLTPRKIIRKYPVGRRVRVYFQESDPSISVLEPGVHFAVWMYFMGSIIFLLLGVFIVHFIPRVLMKV